MTLFSQGLTVKIDGVKSELAGFRMEVVLDFGLLRVQIESNQKQMLWLLIGMLGVYLPMAAAAAVWVLHYLAK